MLSIAKKSVVRARVVGVRYNSHAASGPAEPLGPYLKWIGAISGALSLVVYDRFYSDGAISKWVTPESHYKEQQEESIRAVERQWEAQQRPIALFNEYHRNSHFENHGMQPVPNAGPRALHSGNVLDTSDLKERRARTKVVE